MTIYIVEEYDATASYEAGAEAVVESRVIVGAFWNADKAREFAEKQSGGRYMRREVVPVEVLDEVVKK